MSIPGSILGEYSPDSPPPYPASLGGTRASWEADSSLVLLKLLRSILLPYSPFHPGDRTFIEEAAEYLQHTSGREDLRLLLTEDGAWEAFVAEAELSRSPTVKVFLPFSWFLFPFLQMVHPRSSPHPPCLPHPVPLFTRVAFSKASPWIHAELCFVSVLASLSEAESHRKAGPHTVLKADLDFLLPCRSEVTPNGND